MPNLPDSIGDWSTTRLTKFITDLIKTQVGVLVKTYDTLTVAHKLIVADQAQFLQAQTAAVAGTASALPATPQGYVKILDPLGNPAVIPYYKAS